MKLTKNQKHFLKTIKDKNVRKYQKQQFKLQNQFDSVVVFSDNIFKPRNKTIGDFLSQHPLKGILFKEEFERTFGEGFPWYEMESKKFDELVNEFNIKEKAIEILSELQKRRFINPKTPFTTDQIETVIDWMNTWEQLKDTAIPIRFKEDFTIKK